MCLTAAIDQETLAPGQTATVTFELENVTARPVTLWFPALCHILPYVRDSETGEIVHPAGGGWGCPTAISTLELAPREVVSQPLHVQAGGTAPHPVVVLGPGEYAIHAELGTPGVSIRENGRLEPLPDEQLISNAVSLVVQ